MTDYKNVFEVHPAKKGKCPQCLQPGKFRYYAGYHGEPYGKCERANACGFHAEPPRDSEPKPHNQPSKDEIEVIKPKGINIDEILNDATSNFHKFCIKLGITPEHLKKCGVGTDQKGRTVFLFFNLDGSLCNLKYVNYTIDGHRDGNMFSLSPYACGSCGNIHNSKVSKCLSCESKQIQKADKKRFRLSIFMQQTWSEEKKNGRYSKKVCLIESEKTAVIASFFYKDYDFGAYSAATSLTDDKISEGALYGRSIYNLRDADKAGRTAHAEKQMKRYKLDFYGVDLFPDRDDGYDLADGIQNGLRPVIHDHVINTEETNITNEDKIKSILPDGVNPDDYYKYGFYEKDGGYYSVRESRGHVTEKCVCGFVMNVLYLVKSKQDPKRIVQIKNRYGYESIVDMPTDAFTSLGNFKKTVEREGNFVFEGNETDLTRLKKKLFGEEVISTEVNTLGWQPNDKLFAFCNGMYNGDFHKADKYGIVDLDDKNYFLPFTSSIYEHDGESFEDERKFKFIDNDATPEKWMHTISEVYGTNGQIMIAYYISSLFRDFIFRQSNVFPMLFHFGVRSTGKSTAARSLMYLFGPAQDQISLENPSSTKSIFRTLANFRNALVWLDEYKNGVGPGAVGMLKGFYDGSGYKRAQFSNDNRTKNTPVNSSVIVSGQEMPNLDNALFTRFILLQFTEKGRNPIAFNRLRKMEEKGLSKVTTEFIKHRDKIEKYFKENYTNWYKQLKTKSEKDNIIIEDRMLLNNSILMATASIMIHNSGHVFPFTESELLDTLYDSMKAQKRMEHNSKDTQKFWQVVEFLAREGRIEYGSDYKITGKELLIRFGRIHPLYMKEHRQMFNTQGLDQTSCDYYLKQDEAFITVKKARFDVSGAIGSEAYKDGKKKQTSTSAFVFHYDKIGVELIDLVNDENGYPINNEDESN